MISFISALKSDYQVKTTEYKQLQSIISRLNDFVAKNCATKKEDDANQMSFNFGDNGGTGDE